MIMKKKWHKLNAIIFFPIFTFIVILLNSSTGISQPRETNIFCDDWKFKLADISDGYKYDFDDSDWRVLDLPHDWGIEGKFAKENPADYYGGALPGGLGWYRKTFTIPDFDKDKLIFIDFDGVYRNSEVWINDQYLGKRPYGYSSFRYELTPYLKYGKEKNVIAVKVDNSQQPNSRWYSGSGIYRNVWLVKTNKIHVDHWGTFIITPEVNDKYSSVNFQIKIKNTLPINQAVILRTVIYDKAGKQITYVKTSQDLMPGSVNEFLHELKVDEPELWSVDNPSLYNAVLSIETEGKVIDKYETPFGIRSFYFDVAKGFFLNGKPLKIYGVCNHHDLGFLGAAINTRALERQLEIMKGMGVNSIRTSHNPPAPELLELCDKMGFLVMDEAFDMWKMKKVEFDYSLDWDEWHKHDLEDLVLRDRNHPSVFMWSIGNEIPEQWDSTGIPMTKELVGLIKNLDNTRPVISNLNDPQPKNFLYKSGALDLVGFSYHQKDFAAFPDSFPGQKFIGSETTSGLMTRGHYDMPSDSIRRWPIRWDIPFVTGNPDLTCSEIGRASCRERV